MTEPIKLPPLPDPTYRSPSGTGNYFDGYTKQSLESYATAAIEPYAKRVAELEAQKSCADSSLRYEQALSELIDKIVPGLDSGDILADASAAIQACRKDHDLQWIDPIALAPVNADYDKGWTDAVSECKRLNADRQARGEPVVYRYRKPIVNDYGIAIGYKDWIYSEQKDFLDWWPHESLFTTPQPKQQASGPVALEYLRTHSASICGAFETLKDYKLLDEGDDASYYDHEIRALGEVLAAIGVGRPASEPVAILPVDHTPPYDNCMFRHCDLPGQCRGDGKCLHPARPAAIKY